MGPPNQREPGQVEAAGQWLYGLVPGSVSRARRIHRRSPRRSPRCSFNKYSPRKAQAAYLALWLGSGKKQHPDRVPTRVNTFNRCLAKEH